MNTKHKRTRGSLRVSLLLAVLSVLLVSSAMATVVTKEEANQVSRNWLTYQIYQNGSWADSMMPRVNDGEPIYHEGVLVGYYFLVEPSGYIVVPILKELPAIKAYSETDQPDMSEAQGMAGLLKDVLLHRIQLYEELYGSVDAPQPATGEVLLGREHAERWTQLLQSEADLQKQLVDGRFAKATTIGPMLTENWHQGDPYNELCPMGDGGRSVVGCVATATSMIMHHWSWPPSGTGSHSYSWDGDQSCEGDVGGGTLSATFSDAYDWANMLDDYGGGSTGAEDDAVSELCYEVAVAFNMNFGRCGSGASTFNAVTVFPTYFRYQNTTDRENRDDHTPATWFDVIKTDINLGQPIQYKIKGHSIVCDGWKDDQGDDEIHMNYGWASGHNTWYIVDNLHCPWEGCDFNNEYLVRGIRPNSAPPVAICQDVTVYADADCYTEASIDNGSYDPDGQALRYYQIPDGPYPLGVTHVTLRVADPQGLVDECEADVTVIDNTPPVAQCPGDMIVGNDWDMCSAVVDFTVGVTDNCSGATVLANPPSGSTFNLGTTTVHVTATDGSGNTDECSFTVTVQDVQPPEPICPASFSVDNEPDMCSAVVDFIFSVTDNCPGASAVAVPAPGSTFDVGVTEVIVYATDAAGNTGACNFDVTVIDTQNPVIVCPDDFEVMFINPSQAVVEFEATATDNCDDDPTIDYYPPPGSIFDVGTNRVVCIATDFSGNADTCDFSFELVYLDIKPTSCPNPLNVKPYTVDTKDNQGLAASDTDLSYDLDRKPMGVLPVAILGTADFDVTTLLTETITINGVAPIRWDREDVATPANTDEYCGCTNDGRDGFPDLTLKFSRSEIIETLGPVINGEVIQLLITGMTDGHMPFFGGDCVLIRAKNGLAVADGTLLEVTPLEATNNFPNPFNPSTEIQFTIDHGQRVKLEVFNILGRVVNTLTDDFLDAGNHTISWNGDDQGGAQLSSGVYFYRLSTSSTTVTRKMMLLK